MFGTWDVLLFAWQYGASVVAVIVALFILVLLRCLLSGCCCCCCGRNEKAVEMHVAGSDLQRQRNYSDEPAPLPVTTVADQYVCSVMGMVCFLLPVAAYFMWQAVAEDYHEHYEICERETYEQWQHAFKYHCDWCLANPTNDFTADMCLTARRVLQFSRHFVHDDLCDENAARANLKHNHTLCAVRGVLSHIPAWSQSDDPKSYQSVMWIQTVSSSTQYLFIIATFVAITFMILVFKATPALMGRAMDACQKRKAHTNQMEARRLAETHADWQSKEMMNLSVKKKKKSNIPLIEAPRRLTVPPSISQHSEEDPLILNAPPPVIHAADANGVDWYEATPIDTSRSLF